MQDAAQTPIPSVTGESCQRLHLSPGRRWLFRLTAILCGLLPVLLIEIVLRCGGWGYDLRLVIPLKGSPDWYQLNPLFDKPFYGPVDLSGPDPRPFRLPKPAGTIRILVVGGSTVVGFPYVTELSFPRHMEDMLQGIADQGTTIEVLNAGITALNSSAEVSVVEEGLKSDPDVIVVYTGHNEFYGPSGVASAAGGFSPRWYRTMALCRRLYMVQALRGLGTRPPPSDLIESLPGDLHIPLDSTTFRNAVSRFHENLNAMAELAGRAHVPIVFAGPVANERDQPPIEDLTHGSDPDSKWVLNLRVAERELQWGDKAKALGLLETAKAEHPGDPLIEFRLGQANEKSGQIQVGVTRYQLALELDGCRFRAPSVFRSTMQAVAKRHAETGARFIDLYSALVNSPEMPVPGRKCFLEHVHFTWDGNRIVARTIANGIWRDVLKKDGTIDEAKDSAPLAAEPEDHMAAFVLAMMIYQKAPFRDGADAQKLAKELAEDSSFAFSRLTAERQAVFEKVSPADMAGDLMSALVRSARPISDDESGRWLRLRHQRQPWVTSHRTELVEWLRRHGHDDEADQVTRSSDNWP